MYVIPKDEYDSLRNGDGQKDDRNKENNLKDSVGRDLHGQQVNNIEVGDGGVIVIRGEEGKAGKKSTRANPKQSKNVYSNEDVQETAASLRQDAATETTKMEQEDKSTETFGPEHEDKSTEMFGPEHEDRFTQMHEPFQQDKSIDTEKISTRSIGEQTEPAVITENDKQNEPVSDQSGESYVKHRLQQLTGKTKKTKSKRNTEASWKSQRKDYGEGEEGT